ncbi:MAG: hypothetical protein NXI04_15295 [Planctomycetaceae bacterium]|nr:hypothetical protein [Planctomycetaceae bacterium]
MSRLLFTVILGVIACPAASADDAPVTYSTHIRKIFRDNCANCHNTSRARAGLDLSSYAGVIKGSTSGEVVTHGDATDSFLYLTITHAEEPAMPPGKPQMKEKYLNQVRVWIETGMPESPKDVKVTASAAPATAMQPEVSVPAPTATMMKQAYSGVQGNPVSALAASADGSLIAIGSQLQVLLFDGRSAEFLGALPYPEGEVFQLGFSDDGSVLMAGGGTAAEAGNVVLWSTKTHERLHVVGDDYDVVYGCDVSPNGQLVLYGGPDRILKIADTQSGYIIGVIKKHTDWVMAAAFSPEGFIFTTADRDGNAYVFETESRELLHTLRGHSGCITAIAWSHDGNFCYTCAEDGSVRRWNMHTGKAENQWSAHPGGTLSMKVGPEGQLVTAGRDQHVRLWSADGQLVAERKLDQIPTRAAFAGSMIVAGDWKGQTRLWSSLTADPQQLTVPAGSLLDDTTPFLAEVSGPTAITEILEPAAAPATIAMDAPAPLMTLPEVPTGEIPQRLAAARQSLLSIEQQLQTGAVPASADDLQRALAAAAQIADSIESQTPEILEAQVFLKAAMERAQLAGRATGGRLSQGTQQQLKTQLQTTDADLQAVVAACQQMEAEYLELEARIAAMTDRSTSVKSQYISVIEELQKLTDLSTRLKRQLTGTTTVPDARPASAN